MYYLLLLNALLYEWGPNFDKKAKLSMLWSTPVGYLQPICPGIVNLHFRGFKSRHCCC